MCKCKCKGAASSKGPKGDKGDNVIGYKSVNNTIYVDAQYGSNTTGLRERLDLPFATITAAYAVAVSGDLIHVFPGNYTDSDLGDNAVNIFFEMGAIVTSSRIFHDKSLAQTYAVLGYGKFYSTSDSVVVLSGNASNVTFNCYSADSTAGDTIFRLGYNNSAAVPNYITVNCITDLTSAVEENMIKVYSPGGIANINARYCIAPGGIVEMKAQAVGAVVNINAVKYTIVTGANHYSCFHVKAGTLNITGDIYNPRNSNYSLSDLVLSNVGEGLTYIGNIVSTNTRGVVDNSTSAPLTTNGTMTLSGAGTITPITFTSGFNTINSDVTAARASGAVITCTSGINRITGIIKNSTSLAASHVIYKTSGVLILDDAKLIATHASALSLYATTPQNIKVYSAYANRDVSIGQFTNLISGTVMYVDSDVE